MQYVWQYRLIHSVKLVTVDGLRVEVINPGMLNRDAGPDFFNADIKIDGQQWAGNIEFHVRASDWYRHKHDKDPAYDSVILHVVEHDDSPVFRSNGEKIPQMELKCARDLNVHYAALTNMASTSLSCSIHLPSIPSIYITDWILALAHQRLQQKVEALTTIADTLNGDWDSASYIFLSRALGFGKNTDPFERLARATPLPFLRKHADNTSAIEAILFGQAGFIPNDTEDNDYTATLQRDYLFYRSKFNLTPPQQLQWKFSRMHPQNFPYRRIAYLAAIISGGLLYPERFHEDDTLESIRQRLTIDLKGYWSNHYSFGGNPSTYPIQMSRASLDLIIINAIVPLLYAWGIKHKEQWRIDKAIDLMSELKPENNSLVRMFTDRGIKCPDALTSQGLIQLRRTYCEQRKCLMCRIGHRILTLAAIR